MSCHFLAKVDTATIHQGPLVPPSTHQQVSNAGCNSIYPGSSDTTAPLASFVHGNDHSEALSQLFRSKTKAISPFDRKGKQRKLVCSDNKVWKHNFFHYAHA